MDKTEAFDYTGTVPEHTGFLGEHITLYTRRGYVYTELAERRDAVPVKAVLHPDSADARADALKAYARVARQERASSGRAAGGCTSGGRTSQ